MAALAWTYIASDPGFTDQSLLGGFLTWLKAVSLLCLVGWVVSWLVIGVKERVIGRGGWFDYVVLAALILTPLTVMLRVLESVQQDPGLSGSGRSALTALAVAAVRLCCTDLGRGGDLADDPAAGRRIDCAVLVGGHLALAAGLAVGLLPPAERVPGFRCHSCPTPGTSHLA